MDAGKRFEANFKESCDNNSAISVLRLYDNMSGYAGVKNMCDFVVTHYPHTHYLELKSHKGNRLPFSAITETQYEGLLAEANKETGTVQGILIQYSELDIHVFVDIKLIESMKQAGKVSIHYDEALLNGVSLDAMKKRVNWTFDLTKEWFDKLAKFARFGGRNGGLKE